MKTMAIAVAALLWGALPAVADGDPAVQTVQSFYDTLTDTMKHGKALGLKGRYEKLRPAVAAPRTASSVQWLPVLMTTQTRIPG